MSMILESSVQQPADQQEMMRKLIGSCPFKRLAKVFRGFCHIAAKGFYGVAQFIREAAGSVFKPCAAAVLAERA